MSTDDLGLLQISDSFFPTGVYAMSNGLESFIQDQKIKGANQLHDLISVYLRQQMGPADCCVLGNSYDADELDKIIEGDKIIFSMKIVREIREASTRSGIQLLKCVHYVTRDINLIAYLNSIKNGDAHGMYPVALAMCCKAMGVPKQKAGLSLLYSFSVSMVGAALRLGIIQHFDGQKIIHDLKSVILESVEKNIDRHLSSIWQFTPEIDIIQMQHEKMDSKMFIT